MCKQRMKYCNLDVHKNNLQSPGATLFNASKDNITLVSELDPPKPSTYSQ